MPVSVMVAPPVAALGPTMKVREPEESAIITIGVPISAGVDDWSKAPERVATEPEMEPVSVKWHTPGLPGGGGLWSVGGESVPLPDKDEAVPEACARRVNVPARPVTTPLKVTMVGCVA